MHILQTQIIAIYTKHLGFECTTAERLAVFDTKLENQILTTSLKITYIKTDGP